MDNGGRVIKSEDVLSKIKDDGDFDRIRLQIIRKFKDNGELRNNIMSLVKQSKALSCPGVENMKPRQISDAIHQEIGDKLMSQVSDGVWNIIRSSDDMTTEVRETIQSVYNQLSYPNGRDNGESSATMNSQPVPCESNTKGDVAGCKIANGKLIEPPGFILNNPHNKSKNMHMDKPNRVMVLPQNGKDMDENEADVNPDAPPGFSRVLRHPDAPPGFSRVLRHKRARPSTDEDPDVPPGFGWESSCN